MSKLKIFNTIKKELKQFETLFDTYLKELELSEYLVKTKGKMLRPALTILAGKITGNISETTLWSAIAVEMMHNATLIHDDVVDDANKRRKKPTFRAENGDRKAVLYGDYLFAKSLECVIKTGDLKIVSAIANTTGEMSIGEIQQMDASKRLTTLESEYYDIIYKKTATLFICSLLVGYYSSGGTSDWEETIRRIGLNLGMAFQIKDDLLDYDRFSSSGKTFGNDIREKKMTLPLIFALQQVHEDKQTEIKKMINLSNISNTEILKIIDFTYENGGIAYTENTLAGFLRKAQDDIDTLPEGRSQQTLSYLCTYLSERKK